MTSPLSPFRLAVRRRKSGMAGKSTPHAESQERLHLALEGAGLGAWDFNIVTGEQVINAQWAKMLGYPMQEIQYNLQAWQRLIHPEDYSRVMAALNDHLEGRSEQYEVEYRLRSRDRGWIWILSRGRIVIRSVNGMPIRMAGTHRDISQQKLVEEALLRRDAILDAVSSSAELLLTTSPWLEILPEILSRLGQVLQVSRSYLFEIIETEPGIFSTRQVGEWTAPGIHSEFSSGQTRVFLDRWHSILASGNIIQGTQSDFPLEEHAALSGQQIRSLIVMPILIRAQMWGFIGFDDCLNERTWLPAEVDALKVAANILAAGIQRLQMIEVEREEQRVTQELREIALVLSQSLNYDHILDRLLEQAPRVVPFDGACVLLVDGSRAKVARANGYIQANGQPPEDLTGRSFEILHTSNLHQMMEDRQAMFISDTDDDPAWVRLEHHDYRSWVGAPLFQEGQITAFLSLDKVEPHFYTLAHAHRLSLFASQASLALSNARLFDETLQALKREQSLGEITRAISSELDLPVILQRVVRLAVELAGAEAGSMAILDEDSQTLRYPYLYNLPLELSRQVVQNGEGIVWDVIYHRQSLVLNDYPSHPKANPSWAAIGVHALICVPVLVGNSCLGALGVVCYDVNHSFEPRDLSLVEMVGRQAGVALQNARLFETMQRRAAEAETLRQAASAVNSALELDEVLQKILEQLETVIPFDSAAIFMFEDEHLRMKAGRGFNDLAMLTAREYTIEGSLIQIIDDGLGAVILQDAQNDARFNPWSPNDIHGWIGLPLRVHEQKIGYLTVDSHKKGAYRQSDADLAQVFADEVAIAIENARLFQQVQQLAITDPLTGLYNRRYFFEAARREYERAFRYGSPMTIIMIDLDRFKRVNDTYGHLAGDRVLVTTASRCRETLREVDVLARFGGEEFIVLLPQTNLTGALLLAERLRDQILDHPVDAGSQHINISASMGLAELDEAGPDLHTLIQRADQALYASKHSGRGKISVWTPEMA